MTTPDTNPPMPDETRCPQCGAPLVPGALAGLCPACLLKQGAAADTLTGGPARGLEPPSVAELTPLFPQLEILEFIGKGGMGAVYKARQKELDRVVALKILPRGMDNVPGFAERFAREAKALAKLNHPGIVTIHEFGRADGLFYFVMEFVDGVNLRQLVAGGRLSAREALAIVPEICDALQFAHDHGIVHRDIKPANILLDRRGRVKVADFGLAKLVEAGMEAGGTESRSAADATLTEAGKIIGTPSYMAPEQTDRPDEVDHRADIYSLGVVLYELLTGELPTDKLQLPSRKVRVDVRLDEVVLRTLEKQPNLRYQQASQVKAAVETITGSNPAASGPNDDAVMQGMLARDYTLNIGSCLRRGWALVRSDFWPIVGVTALILALLGVVGSVENSSRGGNTSHVASILFLLVNGPLMGGLCLYFLKKIRGELTSVETTFSGFSTHFLHLFLGGFVTFTLTALGFLCLILPGIYLVVAWLFTLPLIIDKRLHFWSAMELSRKTVSRHWFHFFAFGMVLFLLSCAGLIVFIVGFFFVAPIALAALMYAYEDIFVSVSPAAAGAETGTAASAQNPTMNPPAGAPVWRTLFDSTSNTVKPFGWIIALIVAVAALIIWLAIPTHHANRRPGPKRSTFGQVIERLVDHEKIAQGVGLDLDSGNLLSASDWTLKPVANQFRAQQGDLYYDPATREWRALDMSVVSRRAQTLDASPDEVTRVHWKPQHGIPRLDAFPVSYFIRTREGGMGMLQIVGQADDPNGVKIRYKLLQHLPQNAASQPQKPAQGLDKFSTLAAATTPRPPGFRDPPTFGPALERVVNDIDEKHGKECLAVESGDLIDFDQQGISALSKAEQQKWFSDRHINLLVDTVGGRRGLGIRDAMLTLLPPKAWDQQSATALDKAINSENPGVEYKDAGGFRWHLLPVGARFPQTFAFRTGSGKLGLLEVVSFSDNPSRAKLRYKFVDPVTSSSLSWLQGEWAFDEDYFQQQARAAAAAATDANQKAFLEAVSAAVFTESKGMTWTISATEMQSNHPQSGTRKGPYRVVDVRDANTAEIEVIDEGKPRRMVFQREGERLRVATAGPELDVPAVSGYYKKVVRPTL